MDGRALIHPEYTEGLEAAISRQHLAYHPRAFIGRLVTVSPKHRYMQQNVRRTVIRNYEPVTFRRVEPFYLAGKYNDLDTGLFGRLSKRRDNWR